MPLKFSFLEFEKSQNSIDYSGIDELADETEQFARPPPLPPSFLKKKAEQDDYDGSDDQAPGFFFIIIPVSYTHLTLPTIYSV